MDCSTCCSSGGMDDIDGTGTIQISFGPNSPLRDSAYRRNKIMEAKVREHVDFFLKRITKLKEDSEKMSKILRIRDMQIGDLLEQIEHEKRTKREYCLPIRFLAENGFVRKFDPKNTKSKDTIELKDVRFSEISKEKRRLEARIRKLEDLVQELEDSKLKQLGKNVDFEENIFMNEAHRKKEIMESIVNFTEYRSKKGCGFFSTFCC